MKVGETAMPLRNMARASNNTVATSRSGSVVSAITPIAMASWRCSGILKLSALTIPMMNEPGA